MFTRRWKEPRHGSVVFPPIGLIGLDLLK